MALLAHMQTLPGTAPRSESPLVPRHAETIDRSAGIARFPIEPPVLQRLRHHQINVTAELTGQSVFQVLESCEPRTEVVVRWILDEEVDIGARGIELVGRRRAEEFQPSDAIFPTGCSD